MARENGEKKRLGETNKEGGTGESSTSFPQPGSERGDPFPSRALKRSLAACFRKNINRNDPVKTPWVPCLIEQDSFQLTVSWEIPLFII